MRCRGVIGLWPNPKERKSVCEEVWTYYLEVLESDHQIFRFKATTEQFANCVSSMNESYWIHYHY